MCKTFVKNEILRPFLGDLLVRECPGNFVREWTVRESTRNFSYGNRRYGKSGNFRTVPYHGNTNSDPFEIAVIFANSVLLSSRS
jgi:hypothetical protein